MKHEWAVRREPSSSYVELHRQKSNARRARGVAGRRDNYVHPPLLDVLVALVLVVDGFHAARPHRGRNAVLRRHGPLLKSNRMRTDIKEPTTERQERVDRVPLPLPVCDIESRSETAQNRQRNPPSSSLKETSHINKVKAPQHLKTRRSCGGSTNQPPAGDQTWFGEGGWAPPPPMARTGARGVSCAPRAVRSAARSMVAALGFLLRRPGARRRE